METREKQNLLTMIIIVAFLAIALIVGFIIYPEIKENNKKNIQNSHSITKTESTNTISTKTSSITQNITNANTETTETTKTTKTDSTNGYIGREEMDNEKTESIAQTKEERAIDLARKEWGENDKNVTYNVEQKEENIYYVAVRLNDQVQKWYEIDTEKWTIKEY